MLKKVLSNISKLPGFDFVLPGDSKKLIKNFLPVAGIIFLGWELTYTFILIWAGNTLESLFVIIRSFLSGEFKKCRWYVKILSLIGILALLSFFTFFYGVFSTIISVMIFALSHPESEGTFYLADAYIPLAIYSITIFGTEIYALLKDFVFTKDSKKKKSIDLGHSMFLKNVALHISILGFMVVTIFVVVPIKALLEIILGYQLHTWFVTHGGLRVIVNLLAALVIGFAMVLADHISKNAINSKKRQ